MVAPIYILAIVIGVVLGCNIVVLSEQHISDDNAKSKEIKVSSFKEFATEFVMIGAFIGIMLIVIMGPFFLHEWYMERKQIKR